MMARRPVDKDFVLAEIRRCAAENGGTAVGRARFETVTGIRESDWLGRYWARWGDAIVEAGLSPNKLQEALPTSEVLEHLADLVRELGRFPTEAELRLRRRTDPEFPSKGVFARFGKKADLIALLVEHCATVPALADIHATCAPLMTPKPAQQTEPGPTTNPAVGHIYLVRSGKHYKIGQTTDLGRRTYELKLQLPEKLELIHSFETDDPLGIERYWHLRFADRRANGEWFALTKADVDAFKSRRSFM